MDEWAGHGSLSCLVLDSFQEIRLSFDIVQLYCSRLVEKLAPLRKPRHSVSGRAAVLTLALRGQVVSRSHAQAPVCTVVCRLNCPVSECARLHAAPQTARDGQ